MSAELPDAERLAEHIRDWRLGGCEHSLTMGEACSPCLRDRFLEWLEAQQ